MGVKITTGEVRASFVNVFHPRTNEDDGSSAYSMMVLIDKNDTETISRIRKACQETISAKYPNGKVPAKFRKDPLRDGDEERPEDPACKGKMFLNAKSTVVKPKVVKVMGGQYVDIEDPAEFVSGDYCKVSLTAYTYDRNGNQGVSMGLGNILKIRTGEPLGGTSRPEDDFGDPAEQNIAEDDFPF